MALDCLKADFDRCPVSRIHQGILSLLPLTNVFASPTTEVTEFGEDHQKLHFVRKCKAMGLLQSEKEAVKDQEDVGLSDEAAFPAVQLLFCSGAFNGFSL